MPKRLTYGFLSIVLTVSLFICSCSILSSNDGWTVNSINLMFHAGFTNQPYTVDISVTPSSSVLDKTYTVDLYENGTIIANTQMHFTQILTSTVEIPITSQQYGQASSGKNFSVKIHQ